MLFASTEGFDMIIICDVLLIIVGILAAVAGQKMKGSKRPPNLIMTDSERLRCQHPAELCAALGPKTVLLGVLLILDGVYGILERILIGNTIAKAAGVIVLFVIFVWYVNSMQKCKSEYI